MKPSEIKEHSYLPATPQDLITATLSVGEGVVDRLNTRFSWLEVEDSGDSDGVKHTMASRIQEFMMDLNERISRYLVQEEGENDEKISHPTRYAELLTQAVQNPDALSPTLKKGLADLSGTVVTELAPIFKELQTYLHEAVVPLLPAMQSIQDVATPQGLLSSLRVGSAGQKDTYSLFGALNMLASRIKGFPQIDLKERRMHQRLAVEDPLANDKNAYWQSKRREFKQVYGKDITRPELLEGRSTYAVHQCLMQEERVKRQIIFLRDQLKKEKNKPRRMRGEEDASQTLAQENVIKERIQDLQDRLTIAEQAAGRYEDLARWIQERTEQMAGVSDARLGDHVISLSFAWGDHEENVDVLNDLELIKRHDKEFYARLLGIQPGGTSKESAPSDLFGNVLHIAFARSLHQKPSIDTPGAELFHVRMEKLATIDASQTLLVHINEAQWKKYEKAITPQADGATPKANEDRTRALLMAVPQIESYLLRKMFESPDVETREKLLDQLRSATPNDFLRLIRSLPHNAAWYKKNSIPTDIADSITSRCNPAGTIAAQVGDKEYQKKVFTKLTPNKLITLVKSGALDRTPSDVSLYNAPKQQDNLSVSYLMSTREAVTFELWKTTPSERLIEEEEFFQFLKRLSDELEKGDKEMAKLEKRRSKTNRGGSSVIIILDIDPSVEKEIQKIKSQQQEISTNLLAIFNAHPDITQEQWIEWCKRTSTRVETITYRSGKRSIHGSGETVSTSQHTVNVEPRTKTMKALLRHFTPEQVAESRSQAFVLIYEVFPFLSQSDWWGKDLWDMGKSALRYFFSAEKMKAEYLTGTYPANLAPQYKVLYRILPTKVFFSKDFINKPFFSMDLHDFTANMDPSMRKRFLTDLVQCLVNETPMRDVTDAPIEWMKDLLTMAEETIPEDSQYRTLSRYGQNLSSGTVIANNLISPMHFGATSGYWDVTKIGERLLSNGRKESMFEAKILRKVDGTWQIMTTDKLRRPY